MATQYFGSFAIPDQDERLIAGPVNSPGDLVSVYKTASRLFAEQGVSTDHRLRFHWYAEEAGEERPLTTAETAAVLAAFEQSFGGLRRPLQSRQGRVMRGSIFKRGNLWTIQIERDRDPLTGKRRREFHSGYPTQARGRGPPGSRSWPASSAASTSSRRS